MPIRILCPSGHLLTVPERRAGQTVRCPICEKTATIPAPGAARQPSPRWKGPPPLPVGKRSSPPDPPAPRLKPPPPPVPRPKPPPSRPPSSKTASPTTEPAKVYGVQHDSGRRRTVYQLAFWLGLLAAVSMIPAVMELAEHISTPDSPRIAVWAYIVLLLGVIQLVYVVYLVQLPDWSTTWVVMVVTAALAMFYAVGLGIAVAAPADNQIIRLLELTVQQNAGRMTRWCLMMLVTTGVVSYFFSRVAFQWHRSFRSAAARILPSLVAKNT